jgi:hypothetical protein
MVAVRVQGRAEPFPAVREEQLLLLLLELLALGGGSLGVFEGQLDGNELAARVAALLEVVGQGRVRRQVSGSSRMAASRASRTESLALAGNAGVVST